MNRIEAELKKAEFYKLKLIPDTELLELSSDNVARVEAMLMTDSNYFSDFDHTTNPIIDKDGNTSGGSSAYWLIKLKAVLIEGVAITESEYSDLIDRVVVSIDKENSTHLNSDSVGIQEISERIKGLDRETLIDYLRRPDETGLALIKRIAQETKPVGESPYGHVYRGRKNISFASKFCHYACFFLFPGLPEQDNYSIYDSVVKAVLPLYVDYYHLEQEPIKDYATYRKTIDLILSASGSGISRKGFDDLLWYYYKGRMKQVKHLVAIMKNGQEA